MLHPPRRLSRHPRTGYATLGAGVVRLAPARSYPVDGSQHQESVQRAPVTARGTLDVPVAELLASAAGPALSAEREQGRR